MNEGRTTAIFAALAAAAFGLAWWSRPAAISTDRDLEIDIVGKPVFASFEDPSTASSFQIVKYDEDLAQLERFEVTRDASSNLWRLPSYDDYPADAAEQVRDATTPLVGLNVLSIVSFDRGDHSLYGVVNPDDEDLSVSESGVGMLVRVKDDKNQVLASLIVGKQVEQAEGQHYVRIPTEDAVYVVELNTAPFSTDFTKWIQGELLGVRGFDITHIGLRDYAVLPTQRGYEMRRNFDADLSFDPSASKWSLDRLLTYEGGQAAESQLAEDEELQTTALNDLRNAVQDLQIVDVRRKPTGLASDLKADKSLMDNDESLQSLYKQGFFPQSRPDGVEIFATGGETVVGTKDGVRYLLRFGESTAKLSGGDDADTDDSGLRRYLLVTASLDESQFPLPELEPVPETVEEMLAMEREAAGETPDESPAAAQPATAPPAETGSETPETPPAAESTEERPPSPAPASPESPAETPQASDPPAANDTPAPAEPATGSEPASGDEPASSDEPAAGSSDNSNQEEDLNDCGPQDGQDGTADAPASTEPASSEPATTAAEDKPAAAESPAAQEPQEPAAGEATPAETTPAAEAPADQPAQPAQAAPQETEEELQERLQAVRERITKENQRKIDERKEKIAEANKKVQELNARFADWYYVVSDSVYKKLTLSRDKLIKKKGDSSAAPAAPTGLPNGFPGGLPPGLNLPPQP